MLCVNQVIYVTYFDCKIWSDFAIINGEPFLASSRSIGVILNIDWFQRFKHRQYSIGVQYLVILNLPREVRYKRENLILIGLIPGPVEPPKNIYLAPLITNLLSLWHGIPFNNSVVRCALLCIACDLPAGRKTCGFLSHTANLGCSRCYCEFSTGVFGVRDYTQGSIDCNGDNDQMRAIGKMWRRFQNVVLRLSVNEKSLSLDAVIRHFFNFLISIQYVC